MLDRNLKHACTVLYVCYEYIAIFGGVLNLMQLPCFIWGTYRLEIIKALPYCRVFICLYVRKSIKILE